LWQRSKIAICAVSNDGAYIEGQFEMLMKLVEDERRAMIIDVETQFY
jgi:uncharacterized protein YlxP (DUF503 family)